MTANYHESLERLYQGAQDPWEYATDSYEIEKYSRTLAALPRGYYRTGLEIGCSTGVFTQQAAGRVGHLLGIDIASTAIERARLRCDELPGVSFRRFDFIQDDLEDRFDLIFCAEVLFYVEPWQRTRVARKIASWLEPGGHLVLVHARRRETRLWKDIHGEGGAELLHRLFTHVVALPVVAEIACKEYTITVVRGGQPIYSPCRQRFEAVHLALLTSYPLAKRLLRDRVRRKPGLLRVVGITRQIVSRSLGKDLSQ